MDDKLKTIQTLTQELMDKLGYVVTIDLIEEDDTIRVHIKSEEDASMLIGKHARMLASLQRVIGSMLYNKFGEKVHILVDVNDYREAQKERIIGIADNIAQRVMEEDRPARLSSFSAYERKIIHEHITNSYPELQSYSEGEGKYRKLIIAKTKSDSKEDTSMDQQSQYDDSDERISEHENHQTEEDTQGTMDESIMSIPSGSLDVDDFSFGDDSTFGDDSEEE